MTRFTVVLMTGVTVFAFTACGGGSSSNSGGGTNPTLPTESNVYIDTDLNLMWQDDVYAEVTIKPWLESTQYKECYTQYSKGNSSPAACYDTSGDTAITYCTNMRLDGYTDWRLPTYENLKYLHKSEKAKDLQYVALKEKYWTSTSSSNIFYYARSVQLENSSDSKYKDFTLKNDASMYIRCVRNP